MNGNNIFTATEKRALRAFGITAADVKRDGRNSAGDVYTLCNSYYYVWGVFFGYSRPYIYRVLARDFLQRVGFYARGLE